MANELILIVEDNEKNRKLVRDVLTFKGYRLAEAETGEEGVRLAKELHPDLVLMDIQLPGINGIAALGQIREDPAIRDTPVIAVTALDPGPERIKGLEAGADDFLTKPINQPELLARVRSLLRIKQFWDQISEMNRTLEQRVSDQVAQLERMARLKRFFSPHLAE